MEHLHQHPLVTSDILSTDYRSGGLLKCARTVVHHAEYSTMPSMVCTMLWNTNASPAQRRTLPAMRQFTPVSLYCTWLTCSTFSAINSPSGINS